MASQKPPHDAILWAQLLLDPWWKGEATNALSSRMAVRCAAQLDRSLVPRWPRRVWLTHSLPARNRTADASVISSSAISADSRRDFGDLSS
jgi:hypothetical protein